MILTGTENAFAAGFHPACDASQEVRPGKNIPFLQVTWTAAGKRTDLRKVELVYLLHFIVYF